MIRGTFANIRLRNQLLRRRRGRVHRRTCSSGEQTTIYEASEAYQAAGVPLVVLAGKEYGSGSSRDWAAKGTALLGVKAVIAESYERIHRSNLIGMGVVPLQFPAGQDAASLGLTGEETFDISGLTALNDGGVPRTVKVTRRRRRVRRRGPHRHPRRGGLLPQRRHHAVRAAEPAEEVSSRGTSPHGPGPLSRWRTGASVFPGRWGGRRARGARAAGRPARQGFDVG